MYNIMINFTSLAITLLWCYDKQEYNVIIAIVVYACMYESVRMTLLYAVAISASYNSLIEEWLSISSHTWQLSFV